MSAMEDRIERLEQRLNRLEPSLAERVERLERGSGEGKSLGDRLLDLVKQALVPIISGAVILVLGYAVKDSVDQALARERLELSYAAEMQSLVEKMGRPEATRAEMESAALVLATFGDAAAVPLISELQYENSVRSLAAEAGLRALYLTGSERACRQLGRLVSNRTRLFGWQTHNRAIGLLGDLCCDESFERLEAFAAAITNGAREKLANSGIFRLDSLPDSVGVSRLLESIERFREVLQRCSANSSR